MMDAASRSTPESRQFVASLEKFLRRVPGAGPYLQDIRAVVDDRWGPGAFVEGLDWLDQIGTPQEK
jgi:hypothetical protein